MSSSSSDNTKKRSILVVGDSIVKRRPALIELSKKIILNQKNIDEMCCLFEKKPHLYNVFNMMVKLKFAQQNDFSTILNAVEQNIYDKNKGFSLVLSHDTSYYCSSQININIILLLLTNPKNITQFDLKCHCLPQIDKNDIINLLPTCSNLTILNIKQVYLCDENIIALFDSLNCLKNSIKKLELNLLADTEKKKNFNHYHFNFEFWKDNIILEHFSIYCSNTIYEEKQYEDLYYNILNQLFNSELTNISNLEIYYSKQYNNDLVLKRILLDLILNLVSKFNKNGKLTDLKLNLSTHDIKDYDFLNLLWRVIFIQESEIKTLNLAIYHNFLDQELNIEEYKDKNILPKLEKVYLSINPDISPTNVYIINEDLKTHFLNLFTNITSIISEIETLNTIVLDSRMIPTFNRFHNPAYETLIAIIFDLLRKDNIEDFRIIDFPFPNIRSTEASVYLDILYDTISLRNNYISIVFNSIITFPQKNMYDIEYNHNIRRIENKIKDNIKSQLRKKISLFDLLWQSSQRTINTYLNPNYLHV